METQTLTELTCQSGTVSELIAAIRTEGPVTPNMDTALNLLVERSAWMHVKGQIAVDIANETVPILRA